jgi:chaperonin GroES
MRVEVTASEEDKKRGIMRVEISEGGNMIPKPLNDKVVIEPEEAPDKIGNIHIPDSAKQKTGRGTVVAVGPGKRVDFGKTQMDKIQGFTADGFQRLLNTRHPMTLKVGDKVFIPFYGGQEIDVDKKTLLVMHEEDVLAKIEE